MWGQYCGSELLSSRVIAPSVAFDGFERTPQCLGDRFQAQHPISTTNYLDLGKFVGIKDGPAHAEAVSPDGFAFTFDGFGGQKSPGFYRLELNRLPPDMRPPRPGLVYKLTFEAKWVPDTGSNVGDLGIGVMDERGWNESGSAVGVDGLSNARDWTAFEGIYRPRPDTQGIVLTGRFAEASSQIHGSLYLRTVRLTPWIGDIYPSYPSITAYPTRSADGRKLYLIVFNLTLNQDVTTNIQWKGCGANSATYSEINAPTARATNIGNQEAGWMVRDESLDLKDPSTLVHTFPAHSATAIVLNVGTNK